MRKLHIALPALVLSLTACGPTGSTLNSSSVGAELPTKLACANARSEVFNAYYKAYESSADLSASSFQDQLQKKTLRVSKWDHAPDELKATFGKNLAAIHQLLTAEVAKVAQSKVATESAVTDAAAPNETDPVLHLIRLEMRSQLDPQYDVLNQKLDQALNEAQGTASTLSLPCESGESQKLGTESTNPHAGDGHYGALFAMATAYQSCQVLELPLVTSKVEDVQGIYHGEKLGAGWGRKYTDDRGVTHLDLLKKTHYYHRGQTYGPNCANQDAKPMVYDYAGVPVANSAAGSLDFFTNSGGGPALGIDCSAFVSSASAVVGNLYRTSTSNKPAYTRFVSTDFIDPVKSGWNCYDSVKVNTSAWIQSGDIGAVVGHVVMVDQVGSDPFGLARISSASQCDSLSYKNFDFSLIQSSSSKNSLGINRFSAKDYLGEETKMQTMFVSYAKQACKSKFDHVERKPGTSSYGLIRHKAGDSCVADRVTLNHESCISSCGSLQ